MTENRSKKNWLKFAAIPLIVLVGAVGGYYAYNATLQPKIRATSEDFQVSQYPFSAIVYSKVISEGSQSFEYIASESGKYVLSFVNEGGLFGNRNTVFLTFSDGRKTSFELDPGSSKRFEGTLQKGEKLAGTFESPGGGLFLRRVSGNIVFSTCSQTISFSFRLVNAGNANGFVKASISVDGKPSEWSKVVFVKEGGELPQNGSIQVKDCEKHAFSVILTEQTKG